MKNPIPLYRSAFILSISLLTLSLGTVRAATIIDTSAGNGSCWSSTQIGTTCWLPSDSVVLNSCAPGCVNLSTDGNTYLLSHFELGSPAFDLRNPEGSDPCGAKVGEETIQIANNGHFALLCTPSAADPFVCANVLLGSSPTGGNIAIINEDSDAQLEFQSGYDVDFQGNTVTITSGEGYTQVLCAAAFTPACSDERIYFEGTITGTACAMGIVAGDADVRLYSDNSATYLGDWTVNDGFPGNPSIEVFAAGALGDPTQSTVTLGGTIGNACLKVQPCIDIPNDVFMLLGCNNKQVSWLGCGTSTMSGDVCSAETNCSRAKFCVSQPGKTLTITGQLKGCGAFRSVGAGTIILTNPANSCDVTGKFRNVDSTIIIAATGAHNGSLMELQDDPTLYLGDGVCLSQTVLSNTGNGVKTFGLQPGALSATMSGALAMKTDLCAADGFDFFVGCGGTLTISGQLVDCNGAQLSEGFTKKGNGKLVLTNAANEWGDNGACTGTTNVVEAGALLLRGGGQLPNTAAVTVNCGAFFGGTIAAADLNPGSTLASLTFNAGAGVYVDVDSVGGVPVLDLSNVSNPFALCGLNLDFEETVGALGVSCSQIILANTSGTFANAPACGTIEKGPKTYTVTYPGANSVQLELTSSATTDETDIYVTAGTLIIEDVNGGTTDDAITLGVSGTDYIISSSGTNILNDRDAIGTEVDANTVKIPTASVTAGIHFMSAGGTDTLTLGVTLLSLNGAFTVDTADLIIGADTVIDTSGANGAVSIGGAIVDGGSNYSISFRTGTANADVTGATGTASSFSAVYFDSPGTETLTISSPIDTTGGLLVSGGANTADEHTIIFNGNLAGTGDITVEEDVILQIGAAADNSGYSGNWTVDAAPSDAKIEVFSTNTGLGSGTVTLGGSGAEIAFLADGGVYANDITMSDLENDKKLRVGDGVTGITVTLTGQINLDDTNDTADTYRFQIEDNSTGIFQGPIIENALSVGNIRVESGNTSSWMILDNSTGTPNSFVNNFEIGSGTRIALRGNQPQIDQGIDMVTGNLALLLDREGMTFSQPIYKITTGNTNVGIGPEATTATLASAVDLQTTGEFRFDVDAGKTLTVSGVIGGVGLGVPYPNGDGTVIFTGTNTYLGPTTVNNGTLLVNGDNSAATGLLSVSGSNDMLGGNGTIGGSVVLVDGRGDLLPGASPGLAGTLTINGNLDMSTNGDGLMFFDLDALASTNDQIVLTGALDVGTAILTEDWLGFNNLKLGNLGGAQVGTYVLIAGAGPVVGTLDIDAGELTGTSGGITGTLQINGNNLELVVSAVAANAAPTATPTIAGGTNVGDTLTGGAGYADADGDNEFGSTYKWYRSADAVFGGDTEITGATTLSYVTTSSDTGMYIFLEVLPRAEEGTVAGVATQSAAHGPIGAGSTFAGWIGGFGLGAPDQDPTDDPDGDGVVNLLEYAYSTAGTPVNPSVNDATFLLPSASVNGSSQLVLNVIRADTLPANVSFKIEASDNLSSWTDITGTVSVSNDGPNGYAPGGSTFQYTNPTAIGGANSRYMRILIEEL